MGRRENGKTGKRSDASPVVLLSHFPLSLFRSSERHSTRCSMRGATRCLTRCAARCSMRGSTASSTSRENARSRVQVGRSREDGPRTGDLQNGCFCGDRTLTPYAGAGRNFPPAAGTGFVFWGRTVWGRNVRRCVICGQPRVCVRGLCGSGRGA